MKETPFRPPQPCPPPARTLPLPLGLPTAPVPAAPPAAHSNLLRDGHVFREHRCPRGVLPRSLGRGRKSRSCRTSSQAATRAAPEARGRGTAEAAWRGTRGRGMGQRPRARSSRAGRGFRRVPARGSARLGATERAAAHPGSSTSLQLPSESFVHPVRGTPCRANPQSRRESAERYPFYTEQVQRALLKDCLSLLAQGETSGAQRRTSRPLRTPSFVRLPPPCNRHAGRDST